MAMQLALSCMHAQQKCSLSNISQSSIERYGHVLAIGAYIAVSSFLEDSVPALCTGRSIHVGQNDKLPSKAATS